MPVVWLLILLHPGPQPRRPVQEIAGRADTYEGCVAAIARLAYPRRRGWHAHCHQETPGAAAALAGAGAK